MHVRTEMELGLVRGVCGHEQIGGMEYPTMVNIMPRGAYRSLQAPEDDLDSSLRLVQDAYEQHES